MSSTKQQWLDISLALLAILLVLFAFWGFAWDSKS